MVKLTEIEMEDSIKLTKDSPAVDPSAQQQESTLPKKDQEPTENGKSTDPGSNDAMKVDLPDGKSTDPGSTDDMIVDDAAGCKELPESKSNDKGTNVENQQVPPSGPCSLKAQAEHVLAKESKNVQNDVEMAEADDAGTAEERAAFMVELEKFHKERSLEFKPPKFYGQPLNCLKLWRAVIKLGGYELVTASKLWRQVGESFHPPKTCTTISWTFRIFYEKALLEYERNKVKIGELQLPISPFSQPLIVETKVNTYQSPGSGRAMRDAAARAMQGWHAQRYLGFGEIAEPIIKDKSHNSSKREKNLKSNGVQKQKTSSNPEQAKKAALPKADKQSGITVVTVGPPADWVKVTVREMKDCFEVYALVPGLLREEVKIQSDPAGRLVITGQPEDPNNPWGVTPFQKVVTFPARINPYETSAVVSLHGRLFVHVDNILLKLNTNGNRRLVDSHFVAVFDAALAQIMQLQCSIVFEEASCDVYMMSHDGKRMLCGWRIRQCRPSGGFRLKPRRRLFVHRLQVKFLHLVRSLILRKWKLFSYEKAIKFLKKGTVNTRNIHRKAITRSSSTRSYKSDCSNKKMMTSSSSSRSYDHLSSFYSEAISDCLEFIKMSISAAPSTATANLSADHHERKSSDDLSK